MFRISALSTFVVLLVLGGTATLSLGLADDETPTSLGRNRVSQIAQESTATPQLEYWPECASVPKSSYGGPLCIEPGDGGRVSGVYRLLSGLLDDGITSVRGLCIVDNLAVSSLQQCLSPRRSAYTRQSTSSNLTAEMHMLARSWQRIGVPNRADQLYEQVFALMDQNPMHRPVGASLLREWIPLKIALGERDQAKDFAARQSRIDLEAYNCGDVPKKAVEYSFAYQVSTLEELGDLSAARAARQKAESLRDLPDRCDGGCISEPDLRPCR